MTSSEQRALEAYPTLEQAVFDEMYPRLLFTRNTERSAFVKGYEQAEKDLSLTWEDIIELEDLMAMVHYEFRNGIGKESFGKEVLEKFNAMKEEKK